MDAPCDIRQCSQSYKKKNGTIWRCPRTFSIAEHGDRKSCPYHRAKQVRNSKTSKYKEAQRKFAQSEKGKIASRNKAAKYRTTENGAAKIRAYTRSENGRASSRKYSKTEAGRAAARKYTMSEKGKIVKKKQDDKFLNKLAKSLRKMMTGEHDDAVSIPALGSFKNNDEVRAHFELTMDKTWMTWDNHGSQEGVQQPKTTWHIGHRLPKKIFDGNVFEDRQRCFHPRNLFAQCAKENLDNGTRCVLSDEELLHLQDLWPTAANDNLESLKALFDQV